MKQQNEQLIVGNKLESSKLIRGCLLKIWCNPDSNRFAYFLQSLIGRYSRGKLDIATTSKFLFKGLASYTSENPAQIQELCKHLAEAFSDEDSFEDLEEIALSNNKIETKDADLLIVANFLSEAFEDLLPKLKEWQQKHELQQA